MIEPAHVGEVPALNVRWLYKGSNYQHRAVFPPTDTAEITYPNDFAENGAEVEYESILGTKWINRATRVPGENNNSWHIEMTIRRR